MSQRLFRYADLMDSKYGILIDAAAKQRPARKNHPGREPTAPSSADKIEPKEKTLKEINEKIERDVRAAKAEFVDLFNNYLSWDNTPVNNPSSSILVMHNVKRPNRLLHDLYSIKDPTAREIYKILQELFVDRSGTFDHLSKKTSDQLTKLSNRINKITQILSDPAKIDSMKQTIYNWYPDEEQRVTRLHALDEIIERCQSVLSRVSNVFSKHSSGTDAPEIEFYEGAPISPTRDDVMRWFYDKFNVDKTTLNFIGIYDLADLEIAYIVDKSLLEDVYRQSKRGQVYPGSGLELKDKINAYKTKKHLETGTNEDLLDREDFFDRLDKRPSTIIDELSDQVDSGDEERMRGTSPIGTQLHLR